MGGHNRESDATKRRMFEKDLVGAEAACNGLINLLLCPALSLSLWGLSAPASIFADFVLVLTEFPFSGGQLVS